MITSLMKISKTFFLYIFLFLKLMAVVRQVSFIPISVYVRHSCLNVNRYSQNLFNKGTINRLEPL